MRSNTIMLAAGICAATATGAWGGGGGLVTQDLTQNVTLDQIIQKLVGPNVTVSNVSYTGDDRAIGLFSGGAGIIGFDAGIILSTGLISDAVGPNSAGNTSTPFGTPGDPDLQSRVGGSSTFDAAVLEFTIDCEEAQFITVRYVFASEEYNEYVDSNFNDVFGFYLNGVNISLIGGQPVAINSINCGNPFGSGDSNCLFFINNELPGASVNVEYDGLTVVLTATAPLQPLTNTIKIAIADVFDAGWDSAIFIENGSFDCTEQLACGSESAGDCCSIHNDAYCNDAACCKAVCSVDASCCETLWDQNCVAIATLLCDACQPKNPPKGSLVLEAADCQDDAFPDIEGQQIEVCLSMENLTVNATGYQAFILFDDDVLNYRGDLSYYSDEPFPLHVTPTATANVVNGKITPGQLRFDGSSPLTFPPAEGTDENAKLVTIVFDVKSKCDSTSFGFGGSNFDSELSFGGVPIPTNLTPSKDISLDDDAPKIYGPAGIKQNADVRVFNKATEEYEVDPCAGAVVYYEVGVEDNCNTGKQILLTCDPPSGSFFPLGNTEVVCTATDKCGNTSTHTFIVEINATNTVKADVMLWGSEEATRCIYFVTSLCGISAHVPVDFSPVPSGAKGQATFDVPCGDYAFLCAKDEQHTKWDTVTLGSDPTCWFTMEQIVLRPGDTDNDGDVDINDVTWLVATFGNLDAPGGCPWDGTRDADFSNNGAVASEDWSLLSAEWLTKSKCHCENKAWDSAFAAKPELQTRIVVTALTPLANAADLDRNGVFDWRDVELFERAHALPNTLSRRMRVNE